MYTHGKGSVMSRLDRHVSLVQNKLALRRFIDALAWTALFISFAVLLGVLVWKVLGFGWRPSIVWWLVGSGAALVGVAIYAIARRPSAQDAAIAIDQQLSLKEKFSTALAVRPSKDLFAQAVVRDAESTADNVHLQRQFPVEFPKVGFAGLSLFLLAFLLGVWMNPMDLFGHQAANAKK